MEISPTWPCIIRTMYAPDSQLTASQVLRTFHHDELYLFLGVAFTTFGLISVAFAFLSRKFDAVLFWLGLFAILYGQRVLIDLRLLALMIPPSVFFDNLRWAINYLVPIPAFLYFDAAGFLTRFGGRKTVIVISIPLLCLVAATFLFGHNSVFELINNGIVIVSVSALTVQSMMRKDVDHDSVIIRRAVFLFSAFVLYNNITASFGHFRNIEPFGFAFFLATLGYVAAKRSLARDHQFSEIQKELEIARRIQMDILPQAYPASNHFKVAARYVPMTSVAGDFYDFLIADDKHAGLLIADVSGHGVPAALIASMVKLAATSQRANAADPAALLSGMNAVLCGNTQSQFVTAAYVYLDATSSTLRYSAAAHPPMLLLRTGKVIELTENGLMLAAFSFATYSSVEHRIEPGDRIVLYTDGLLEAANTAGEEFGPQRLSALLRDGAHLNAEAAADHIISSLKTWARSQNDDLTILICDYAPG
jgi:sigma-B regulation protein RsbU (phosphoserine phosphatase)